AGVRASQTAPDFYFDGTSGGRLALRWLRGRLVVLLFAEADATPSRSALRALKRLERAGEQHQLFPIAVLDGANRKAAAAVRRQLGARFPIVPDPQRAIGTRYGISCWPTTVIIDRDGTIARVSMGAV